MKSGCLIRELKIQKQILFTKLRSLLVSFVSNKTFRFGSRVGAA